MSSSAEAVEQRRRDEAAEGSPSELTRRSSSRPSTTSPQAPKPQSASSASPHGDTELPPGSAVLFLLLITSGMPQRVPRVPRPPRVPKPPKVKVGRKGPLPKPDVLEDDSIGAALRMYQRSGSRKRRLRVAGASAEKLAEVSAVLQRSLEELKFRIADPSKAEELQGLPPHIRRKKRSSQTSATDDGSMRSAHRMYQRALEMRRKEKSASPEVLAQLSAAVLEKRVLLAQRYRDPVNAEELKSLPSIFQPKSAPTLISVLPENQATWMTDAKDGQVHRVWRSTGDDHSFEAARRLKFRSEYALGKARTADAGAEVIAALRQACQTAKEIYEARRLAKVAAKAGAKGQARAREDVSSGGRPRTPDDGSIKAALRVYQREFTRRAKLRKSGAASEEELAQADAVVQESLQVVQSRRADPANAKERREELESRRMSVEREAALPSDEGSLDAAYNARQSAKRSLSIARRTKASAEEIAKLEAAYEASKELYEQRSNDPSNAELRSERVVVSAQREMLESNAAHKTILVASAKRAGRRQRQISVQDSPARAKQATQEEALRYEDAAGGT